MHKFLRAIGFSDITRKDLELIMKDIIDRPDILKGTRDSEGNDFSELTCEYARNLGIKVCGTYNEDDQFNVEYYYPYMTPRTLTTQEPIEIQKHASQESFAGVSDEISLGVTLIFYVQNVADYLSECRVQEKPKVCGAYMSALSTEGKILFPVQKTAGAKVQESKNKKRNQLIAEAREGNEEAIESLTLEDMDTYSLLSRRITREDIYSIVTTSFMPYGVESDQYSILGEILDLSLEENTWTGEQIYCMKIECNDLIFDVCINQKDLEGEPEIGRRFKGNVWMQGVICL